MSIYAASPSEGLASLINAKLQSTARAITNYREHQQSQLSMQRLLNQLADLSRGSPSLEALHDAIRSKVYLRSSWFKRWLILANQECSIGFMRQLRLFVLRGFSLDNGAWGRYRALRKILSNQDQFRDFINNQIVELIISDYAEYFDAVENAPLTRKQREAAASDEDSTLVVAGAGTGKTSTIVAKIGLLIKSGQCKPSEILAISYTNKSANELSERVKQGIDADVTVSTFHKLGLSILAQTESGKPTLAPFAAKPVEKAKFVQTIIDELNKDEQFQQQLIRFMAYHRVSDKVEWSFESLAQYRDWLKSSKIISLDGKPKQSYQECIIANWLILNGVRFEYERKYEHSTKTINHRQYHPDFYLPDANLYLEHFGVDENGRTAPYINSEKYWQGIEWKRNTHKKFNTTLIETYSWEHNLGVLESNLKHWLKVGGCQFSPITTQEALEIVNKSGVIDGFSELVANFITLYKGNGCKISNAGSDSGLVESERNKLFLELFEPIFEGYENQIHLNQQIDFEDMISRATKAVEDSYFKSPYRYVLVDEFQDISPGRAALLRALQRSNPNCALFAVGDDWQSIYRFAGSDIGAMTKFVQLFGATRVVALDKTFRFDDSTIDVSSKFILKNSAQIKKTLVANSRSREPSIVIYKRGIKESRLDWSLKEIEKQADAGASVLILERYGFHLPADGSGGGNRNFSDSDEYEYKWARLKEDFPTLSLSKLTIHSAKGLEADYSVIGLRGGLWGFPSQKVDDPLFDMVLTQADQFPNGEERRLFYVAITRARKKTYLVCETQPDQSIFAAELQSGEEYPISVFGVDTEKLSCPECKSGVLLLHKRSNGNFYGCSNYPLCDYTEQTC